MTDHTLDPKRKTELSSFLDQETPSGAHQETQNLLGASFGAQVHYRNLESISRACQQHGAEIGSHGNFLGRLMGALDSVEQLDENEDFECLSAWLDGAESLDAQAVAESAIAQTHLQNIQHLSQALQALPQPQAPAHFVAELMAQLEPSANQQILSRALQALPTPQASSDFAAQVMARIENEATPDALSRALQALPSPQAPEHFAAQVMAQIEALTAHETVSDFETLSAYQDGELQDADQRHLNTQALKPIQALSAAMQHLPQPEAPVDFVARVMLATEVASKPKLFALPLLFRSRVGQVAASFAFFGLLVMGSQTLLSQTQLTPELATGPSLELVQVEHQPEDILFADVMEHVLELENINENDYTLWIGG